MCLSNPPEQFTVKLKVPELGVSAASPHFRAPVSLCPPGLGTVPELPNCCTPAAEATVSADYLHTQQHMATSNNCTSRGTLKQF